MLHRGWHPPKVLTNLSIRASCLFPFNLHESFLSSPCTNTSIIVLFAVRQLQMNPSNISFNLAMLLTHAYTHCVECSIRQFYQLQIKYGVQAFSLLLHVINSNRMPCLSDATYHYVTRKLKVYQILVLSTLLLLFFPTRRFPLNLHESFLHSLKVVLANLCSK